jgi:hypothetical protein
MYFMLERSALKEVEKKQWLKRHEKNRKLSRAGNEGRVKAQFTSARMVYGLAL